MLVLSLSVSLCVCLKSVEENLPEDGRFAQMKVVPMRSAHSGLVRPGSPMEQHSQGSSKDLLEISFFPFLYLALHVRKSAINKYVLHI